MFISIFTTWDKQLDSFKHSLQIMPVPGHRVVEVFSSNFPIMRGSPDERPLQDLYMLMSKSCPLVTWAPKIRGRISESFWGLASCTSRFKEKQREMTPGKRAASPCTRRRGHTKNLLQTLSPPNLISDHRASSKEMHNHHKIRGVHLLHRYS